MSKPGTALAPLLAGAMAAAAVALVIGWPGRPPLTHPALVTAALAVAAVAVLLVVRVAAAARHPGQTCPPIPARGPRPVHAEPAPDLLAA
jgi:anti-sigma factor RsiW